MGKRGVFELQVRWAFAIIVGAMLLLFFVGVVQKQMERSSYIESQKAASFLEESFTRGEATLEVTLPRKEKISLDCESRKLAIGKGSITWPEGVEMFARDFSSNTLQISKVDVKLPFLFGRAMLITPEDMQIVMAFDDSATETASNILDVFGEQVSLAGVNQLNAIGNLSLLAIIVDGEVKADEAIGLKADSASIVFMERKDETWKVRNEAPYLAPSLFTAAIASDFENYKCGVESLLARMPVVADRYEAKAKELESFSCNYPVNELAILKSNASYSIDTVNNLLAAAKEIEEVNEVLADNSCEVLY
jgi:hypothetical protein